MRKFFKIFLLILLPISAYSSPTVADEVINYDDMLSFSVGLADVNRKTNQATTFRIEFRNGEKIYKELRPFYGMMITSDSSNYIYAGLLADIPLSDRIVFTPSFAPGYYDQGDGKDLGKSFPEFKSQIELSYKFDFGGRLGLSLDHISNASTGDTNPGIENLTLTFIRPLDF